MSTKINNLIYLLVIAGVIGLTGCSSATAASPQPPVQSPAQTSIQQSAQQPVQPGDAQAAQPNSQPVAPVPAQTPVQQSTPSSSVTTTNVVTSPPVLSNRVDVIYFHAKLRCVTCLCFEKEVTNIIKTYFQDDINSGKLTYRVLNIQEPQNAAITKKYGALGSQLFINTVTNDFDSIEDIQDIWSWNCVDNPAGFDTKVKSAIELRLKGQR